MNRTAMGVLRVGGRIARKGAFRGFGRRFADGYTKRSTTTRHEFGLPKPVGRFGARGSARIRECAKRYLSGVSMDLRGTKASIAC